MNICERCGREVEPAEEYDTVVGILCPDCYAIAVENGEIER